MGKGRLEDMERHIWFVLPSRTQSKLIGLPEPDAGIVNFYQTKVGYDHIGHTRID